jgi:hypothetical protein
MMVAEKALVTVSAQSDDAQQGNSPPPTMGEWCGSISVSAWNP